MKGLLGKKPSAANCLSIQAKKRSATGFACASRYARFAAAVKSCSRICASTAYTAPIDSNACAAGPGWTERFFYMLGRPARVIEETDLILLAVDRPEIRRFHLARPRASGLDRGLIHGLHAGGANRV